MGEKSWQFPFQNVEVNSSWLRCIQTNERLFYRPSCEISDPWSAVGGPLLDGAPILIPTTSIL